MFDFYDQFYVANKLLMAYKKKTVYNKLEIQGDHITKSGKLFNPLKYQTIRHQANNSKNHQNYLIYSSLAEFIMYLSQYSEVKMTHCNTL